MPSLSNPKIVHKNCTSANQLDKLDVLSLQSQTKDWDTDLLSAHQEITVDMQRLREMPLYFPIKNRSKAQNIFITNFEPVN